MSALERARCTPTTYKYLALESRVEGPHPRAHTGSTTSKQQQHGLANGKDPARLQLYTLHRRECSPPCRPRFQAQGQSQRPARKPSVCWSATHRICRVTRRVEAMEADLCRQSIACCFSSLFNQSELLETCLTARVRPHVWVMNSAIGCTINICTDYHIRLYPRGEVASMALCDAQELRIHTRSMRAS